MTGSWGGHETMEANGRLAYGNSESTLQWPQCIRSLQTDSWTEEVECPDVTIMLISISFSLEDWQSYT